MTVSNMPITTMQLLCPRCGDLFEHPLRSALSRYHAGRRICSTCGHNEAMFGYEWTEGTIVERLQQECAEREQECAAYAVQLSRLQDELTQMRIALKQKAEERYELRRQVRQLTAAVEGLASFDAHQPMEERLAELVGKTVELEIDGCRYVGILQRKGSYWMIRSQLSTHAARIDNVREFVEF